MHHIQSRTDTYSTGLTAVGEQALLGWIHDVIAVLLFDPAGNLRTVRREPIEADLSRGFGPEVEARVTKQIQSLQATLGFQERPIAVAPFSVPDLHVELRLLPEYLEEYVRSPRRFSNEAEWYESSIRDWVSAGKSTLRWGNYYYLNRDGFSF